MARWDLTVRRERFLAISCENIVRQFWLFLAARAVFRVSNASYLRDTLLVLSSEEDSPCDPARVLALEEQRLGLAVLETEDLGIATDVELAL